MRKDLEIIASFVKKDSKVLEIGCSNGELLDYLVKNKSVTGRGIEILQEDVSKSVAKGLSVIQGDADSDLRFYPDNSFDYVVSSQVIQATKDPKDVLEQICRIGKKVIVAIPNFGYWYNRFYLGFYGKMPVSSSLSYQWYETPNIHFCTVKDFKKLCNDINCTIEKEEYLDGIDKKGLVSTLFPNLFSSKAIFVIS